MEEVLRFKIGDRIVRGDTVYDIVGYYTDYSLHYEVRWVAGNANNKRVVGIPITLENDIRLWNDSIHYDPGKFKPFDKVLTRFDDNDRWEVGLFSSYAPNTDNQFHCICLAFPQCIPYIGNEELLGTTDPCDKFYCSWEDNKIKS